MKNLTVLIVDDEEDIQNILSDRLKMHGYEVFTASSGSEALKIVDEILPELVLLDIRLTEPELDGIEILKRIKQEYPEIIVMMITAHGTIQLAVEAMQLGAFDFIQKPFEPDPDIVRKKVDDALQRQVNIRENQYLRSGLKGNYDNIIGKSPKLMEVLHKIDKIAPSDSTVLITGETGTGKDLIAEAIHYNSPRRNAPFVPVNCPAIPETLIESELFGHEKGSFSGAISRQPGKIERAEGGTLFLDEIGDMSYELQARLFRVIQNREFERVGGKQPIKADVRFISATNQDLRKAIQNGKFRQELYYRLNVVNIEVPPLRELVEDIPILIEHFIKKYSEIHNKQVVRINDEAKRLMMNYKWDGNTRELQHCIENIVLLSDHETIYPDDLPQEIRNTQIPVSEPLDSGIVIQPGTALSEVEKRLILKTLEKTGGDKAKTAELLGICVRKIYNKIKEYAKNDS